MSEYRFNPYTGEPLDGSPDYIDPDPEYGDLGDFTDYDDCGDYDPFAEDPYTADYGEDDEPEALSFDQIRQLVREESDRIQQEAFSEEDAIDRAVQRTAQAMEAFYAQREEPMARRELVEDLTVGLGTHARQYLNNYFHGYTPDVFAAIRKDPKTMDMLRRAAEYEDARRSTLGAVRTSDDFERSIDAMWKGGFSSVPGLTKERFRDEMRRRVS